jgi:succinyl-CoA synthetase beta subunit
VALEQVQSDVPLVVRLLGTNAEEGRRILSEANMQTAYRLTDAAEIAVEAAKEHHQIQEQS